MTASAHATMGALIAAKFANPLLAIPLALASHVIADSIPHWDAGTHRLEKTNKRLCYEGFIDEGLGFIIAYVLIAFFFPHTNLIYAFFIIIAAQFFDIFSVPYYMLNLTFPPFSWIEKLQQKVNKTWDKPKASLLSQIAAVGSLLIAAVKF